jgi:hypothetical protein
MKLEQEIAFVKDHAEMLVETFARKRADYGPTTTETFEKFGPVSMLIRMHDKLGRLDNLIGNGGVSTANYESVEDTLVDLANYCLIALLEIEKDKARHCCVANDDRKYNY